MRQAGRVGMIAAMMIALAMPLPLAAAPPVPGAPSPAAGTMPSAADYAQLPFVELAELSPDGTRIAGLFGVDGEQRIGVLSLFDKAERRQVMRVPEGTEVSWLRWLNDDFVLVGVSALQQVAGRRWYITRVVSFDRKTQKVTRLLPDAGGQAASDVIWTAGDGSNALLLAAQNSIYLGDDFWPGVYRVDAGNGRGHIILRGQQGVMHWSADSAGIVRAGVDYNDDNRSFRLLYRPSADHAAFHTVERADSRKRQSLLRPVVFLAGSDHALVRHEDADGRDGIFEMDMLTQQDIRPVYLAPPGAEIAWPIVSGDQSAILGIRLNGTARSTHWLDADLARVQDSFDKAVPGRRATIISLSRNSKRMLVRVDRPETPGLLYYFDVDYGRLQKVASYSESLDARSFTRMQAIRYPARDGTPIEAILTFPRDRPEKALPVVVMPHGGPWAHDTMDFDFLAQFIASRGYAVIQPNFRGSTGYGLAFERKGEGQLGLAMQDDLNDALQWAAKAGIADPARACIVGASYGGYAAMWGIARDPDLWRCAISIAGVASLRREVNDFGNQLMGGKFRDDWTRMTPDFAMVSPLNAVARIKAPLLLIHGRRDVTVDYGQSDAMYGRMRDAGKTVELVPLPLADHHFTRQADRLTMLTAIEGFLARHNPAGTQPAPPR